MFSFKMSAAHQKSALGEYFYDYYYFHKLCIVFIVLLTKNKKYILWQSTDGAHSWVVWKLLKDNFDQRIGFGEVGGKVRHQRGFPTWFYNKCIT